MKHLDGSIPERVPGKQGETPRPLGRRMRHKVSAFQGLPWGIDTYHFLTTGAALVLARSG